MVTQTKVILDDLLGLGSIDHEFYKRQYHHEKWTGISFTVLIQTSQKYWWFIFLVSVSQLFARSFRHRSESSNTSPRFGHHEEKSSVFLRPLCWWPRFLKVMLSHVCYKRRTIFEPLSQNGLFSPDAFTLLARKLERSYYGMYVWGTCLTKK